MAAKAYWVVHVDAAAPGALRDYIKLVRPFLDANGGRYLVQGGRQSVTEGRARAETVVIEFDSFAEAERVYNLPEYQAIKALRTAVIGADFVVVEGVAR
jgi:uncharacterized protein (DUF1330 family)